MEEMEHLRQILDYIPCVTCEELVPEEERLYMCTLCSRLSRVISAEKALPKWKLEGKNIIAVEGLELDELRPSIRIVEPEKTIAESLIEEIEILEIGVIISEEEIPIEEELPEWESITVKPYTYKGYTLYTKEVILKGNRKQRIYFFSKKEPAKGSSPTVLPKGYRVKVNKKTGLPFLKKK